MQLLIHGFEPDFKHVWRHYDVVRSMATFYIPQRRIILQSAISLERRLFKSASRRGVWGNKRTPNGGIANDYVIRNGAKVTYFERVFGMFNTQK